MRNLTYKVEALSSVIIPLGIQGETGATTIRVDFTEWLRDGVDGYPAILVLTPNGETYPAATNREDLSVDGGSRSMVVWPITDVDTDEYGDGAIRVLLYSEDGVLMKSATARTSMAPSFINANSAPGQYEFWLERMTEVASQAGLNRSAAEASQAAARQSELNAEASYEAAAALVQIIQEKGDPTILERIMALSSWMNITIPTTEWEESDGAYVVTRTNALLNDRSVAIFLPDGTAENMRAYIEVDTSEDTLTLTTSKVPGGTISGMVAIFGYMDVEDEE